LRWKTSWLLVKDVGLTGTGIFVIVTQAFSAKPNGLLLGTGLALTVPSTWEHIKALLPSSGDGSGSSGDGPSSEQSPSRGELPSPPSQGRAGE
jgi:hypothetical protein